MSHLSNRKKESILCLYSAILLPVLWIPGNTSASGRSMERYTLILAGLGSGPLYIAAFITQLVHSSSSKRMMSQTLFFFERQEKYDKISKPNVKIFTVSAIFSVISLSPSFMFYIKEISFLIDPNCYLKSMKFSWSKPTTEKQMPLIYINIYRHVYICIFIYVRLFHLQWTSFCDALCTIVKSLLFNQHCQY